MAKTMYAWSNIHLYDKDKKRVVILKPGSKVTQEQLGYDDEQWDEICESGAIRPGQWPEGTGQWSPNEYRMRKLRLEREALEAEMASVGGSSGESDTTSPQPPPEYELDDDGNPKLDEDGNPVPKTTEA